MGIATKETIEGMQSSGVQATAKHYIVNEQELNRETISSNVGDREMHELYLWPFAEAVHANVASVMCSYNKINGTWACENDAVMTKLLKEELGFPGYVMTDWYATTGTVSGAEAGLDMMMPGANYNNDPGSVWWGPQLKTVVENGTVSLTTIEDKVRRILAAWYLLGQDQGEYPPVNLAANVQGTHKDNVRATARDGIVLLKNDGAILPLKTPKKIAVIGSSTVNNPAGINACYDRSCNNGTLGMGWGSGTVDYPYLVAPLDAIRERAQQDGTEVSASSTDDAQQGATAAAGADAAFVFITSDSGEGYITVDGNIGDRNTLDPWHNGNELVKAAAAVNDNVVVVVHSVGPIILETILAQPGVKAVVWAGLGSQETGNALVDILWGATNPNGKLPYTIGKSVADYGTAVFKTLEDNFAEGIFIDYRHFDRAGIEPRYEFGFGLCKSFSKKGFESSLESHANKICSIHELYLLRHQRHIHSYIRSGCWPGGSRRPRRSLRGCCYGDGDHQEHRIHCRRRDRAVVPHPPGQRAPVSAKAASRIREVETRRRRVSSSDVQFEEKGPELLGCRKPELDCAGRYVHRQGWSVEQKPSVGGKPGRILESV